MSAPGTPPTLPRWTQRTLKQRRARALALALFLAGFVILIVLVTIVRLGGNVATRAI